MRKYLKTTGIIILLIIAIFVALVGFKQNKKFNAPNFEIHAVKDSSTIHRGRYLVTSLGHCGDCHSSLSDSDLINQSETVPMSGGKIFSIPLGSIQSPNITPDKETGIGDFSDKQIAVALRYGIGHDNRALIPFMNYQSLADNDMTAVVSYLRSLTPVKRKIQNRKFSPIGYIANAFSIKPVGPAFTPEKNMTPDTSSKYGKYLAISVAGCRDCHTNRNLVSGLFTGPQNAGGLHMPSAIDPKHYVTISPNLTPDSATGIMATWDKKTFINRFKQGKKNPHSRMPWNSYKNINENDLTAIYNYFNGLQPIGNYIPTTLAKIKG